METRLMSAILEYPLDGVPKRKEATWLTGIAANPKSKNVIVSMPNPVDVDIHPSIWQTETVAIVKQTIKMYVK